MDKSLKLLLDAQLAMHKYCYSRPCDKCQMYDGTQECPFMNLQTQMRIGVEQIRKRLQE